MCARSSKQNDLKGMILILENVLTMATHEIHFPVSSLFIYGAKKNVNYTIFCCLPLSLKAGMEEGRTGERKERKRREGNLTHTSMLSLYVKLSCVTFSIYYSCL
jgi:hypothetical protein